MIELAVGPAGNANAGWTGGFIQQHGVLVAMGDHLERIDEKLADWIHSQSVFFVATAPLSGDGLINCSPKGLDTFRVFDDRTVGYGDFNGSGIETAAHLRENGRIVIMFCAFDGPPRILRLYGTGDYLTPEADEFAGYRRCLPPHEYRGIVRIKLHRVAEACGYGVPKMDFVENRNALTQWSDSKTPEEHSAYQADKNRLSLDGLPGI